MIVIDFITKNMLTVLYFIMNNTFLDAIYVAIAGVIIMIIIRQWREARK